MWEIKLFASVFFLIAIAAPTAVHASEGFRQVFGLDVTHLILKGKLRLYPRSAHVSMWCISGCIYLMALYIIWSGNVDGIYFLPVAALLGRTLGELLVEYRRAAPLKSSPAQPPSNDNSL